MGHNKWTAEGPVREANRDVATSQLKWPRTIWQLHHAKGSGTPIIEAPVSPSKQDMHILHSVIVNNNNK